MVKKMLINDRPGVYSTYEVTSSVTGLGAAGIVGVAAAAESGSATAVTAITSYAEAIEKFGISSNMAALVKLLLLNGAGSVRAVRVEDDDYASAFSLLQAERDVRVLVCDSHDASVHAAMRSSIMTASESCKYRIGIVEGALDVQSLTAAALELNCERMVLAASGAEGITPGSVAAALAGAVCGTSDPAVPFNGAELYGLEALSASYTDAEISALVRGGVTPVERSGASVYVVRGVTTRTQSAGAGDITWRELNTVLIVDDVIPTIRAALKGRFSRSKNTKQTRGAIRTQVLIELENKLAREIISNYGNVTVSANAEDPTVCEVCFDFTVAHGLNQIYLSAHITV